MPKDVAEQVGGHIFVSGSYRLGVNEPGADIDTICIAPRTVTREDFFTTLKEKFDSHPKVTNLVAIEGAIVPLLTFDYEEINIDLQIAILPQHSIPESLDILDNSILLGVDTATEKSLNGPRVTELMIQLTPNRSSFIQVLRIVRRWAKRRGLYSNKMGYLGGINYCILVCFVNQLYPTAAPSTLLLRFFMVLSNWKWPAAIQLCKTHDANLGLEVWNPANMRDRSQIMPILTPAYPSMNSAYNVSPLTLSVMTEEFKRALKLVQQIMEKGDGNWEEFFQPSDFFATHQHYLAVDIFAANEQDQQAWCGYCESRLRKLVESLAYIRQLTRIRAFPKKFPLLTQEEEFGVCFFVAFDVDKTKMRNTKELHINSSVDYFKQNDLYRWIKRKEGMDVKITPVSWKNLPEIVFEDLNGREKAKEIRKAYLKQKKEKLAAAAAVGTALVKRSLDQDETEASEAGDEKEEGTIAEDKPVAEEKPEEETTIAEEKTTEEKEPPSKEIIADKSEEKEPQEDTTIEEKQPKRQKIMEEEPLKLKTDLTANGKTTKVKAAKMKISFGKR